MSKTITKESEVKEGIIVLHYTLAALSEKYDVSIPKKIRKQMQQLINNLERYLGYD